MPQIQIFFIAMPANIMFGLILMLLLIGSMMAWYLGHVEAALGQFLDTLGGNTTWPTKPISLKKQKNQHRKRLEDAWKKGDVAKEPGGEFLVCHGRCGNRRRDDGARICAGDLGNSLKGILEHAGTMAVDGGSLRDIWMQTGTAIAGGLVAADGAVGAVCGCREPRIQHRMVWSLRTDQAEALEDFAALRFQAAVFARVIVQLCQRPGEAISCRGAHGAGRLSRAGPARDTLVTADIGLILAVAGACAEALGRHPGRDDGGRGLDFIWQRQRWHEKQKMTLREVKDEYKQTEGDPAVKSKIRQIRQERSRRRMMANVPDATVVVTNPTHYAVALKYEKGMGAPICVAKGTEAVALKIREVATEHDVPIVENPPLARSLYAAIDVDEEIPEAQYRAVAEVIGYVMRQKSQSGWRASGH